LFQEIDLQANNAEGLDTKDVSWRPELADALDSRSYATTNKLNWLFSLPVNEINTHLTTSASYLHVPGGNYQSKSPY
jgi:hypothetical protein